MFNYSNEAKYGIQFDMKKFYHEVDIELSQQTYFGFTFVMENNSNPITFVWTVMTFGYTRALFIARSLMKPLIKKWRMLNILCAVFYDDGFSVSHDFDFLRKASLQIQCDLLRAGLVPGFEKCKWYTVTQIDWIGLRWNFEFGELSIIPRRIERFRKKRDFLIDRWPNVKFRDVAKCLGQLASMLPVLEGKTALHSRMLQMIVNFRKYYNGYWDDKIYCDEYEDLLFSMAKNELNFWKSNIDQLNSRKFKLQQPSAIGWVDASGVATGGFVCNLKLCLKNWPVTADNCLFSFDPKMI